MALITLTLLKLRALARSKAGVGSGDYSTANLDDQLNIGYVALATLLANLDENYFEEQNVKFSLVANSGLYSLPTDFMAWKQLRLAFSGTPLSPSAYTIATPYDITDIHDIQAEEESIPASNPKYNITGNYFRVKPKPQTAVSNGGRLAYIALPSALANTGDIPVIPVRYHDKIAVYAAREMAAVREKWTLWKQLDAEWGGLMRELEDKIAERDRNRPLRFKAPQEAMLSNRPRELE